MACPTMLRRPEVFALRLIEAGDWDRLLRINLSGPWILTQACLPLLERASDPAVVFALDGSSQKAYWGTYGVAKSALEGLIGILSHEWGGEVPIRVNGIDPGPIRTRLRQAAYPGDPAGELLPPETVADVYAYFLGADSRGITGQTLRLQETR